MAQTPTTSAVNQRSADLNHDALLQATNNSLTRVSNFILLVAAAKCQCFRRKKTFSAPNFLPTTSFKRRESRLVRRANRVCIFSALWKQSRGNYAISSRPLEAERPIIFKSLLPPSHAHDLLAPDSFVLYFYFSAIHFRAFDRQGSSHGSGKPTDLSPLQPIDTSLPVQSHRALSRKSSDSSLSGPNHRHTPTRGSNSSAALPPRYNGEGEWTDLVNPTANHKNQPQQAPRRRGNKYDVIVAWRRAFSTGNYVTLNVL